MMSRTHMRPARAACSHAQAVQARRMVVMSVTGNKKTVETTVVELSPTTRKMNVVVPKNVVNSCFESVVKELKKDTDVVKGFRAESVPLSFIVQQVGGPKNFKMAVIEDVLHTTMPIALREQRNVVPESERIDIDIKKAVETFDPDRPMAYDVEFEVAPPLTWNKSYKELEVSLQDNGNYTTDCAAADDLIRQYRKQAGQMRVVVGRGVQRGDVAVVDMKITMKGGRTPLPGIKDSKTTFDTEIDPLNLTAGFEGAVVGETRKFVFTFPEDHPVELWQSMNAEATVKIHEIFSWVLPDFDDEFVSTHHAKFGTAEEMRKQLVAATALKRVEYLDKQLEDAIRDALVGIVDLPEIPQASLMQLGLRFYQDSISQAVMQGDLKKEDMENYLTEEMFEEYFEKQRSELEAVYKATYALEDVYFMEKLEVDEKDIQAEVEQRAAEYKAATPDVKVDMERLRDDIMETAKSIRAMEWLKDNIKRNVLPFQA